jgi:hypothetical protein
MQPGYVCVAGIDLKTNEHIRPVLPGARLTVDMLKRQGGVFDMGTIVDIGDTQACGAPPETEDLRFERGKLGAVKDMGAASFWQLLDTVSRKTLSEVFGKDLKAQRNGCTVDEGKGEASLGCVRLGEAPEVFVNGWGKIRMRISDGAFDVDLSVTDLRLYQDDQQTPRSQLVEAVQQRIEAGVGVILSVGLARAFQARGDTARRHWLQVNNIHLEDDPVWRAR